MTDKSVGFLTFDWAIGTEPLEVNGCGWYRCALPMKELEKFGWTCGLGAPEYNKEYGFGTFDITNGTASYGWDIVVLKLVMLERVLEIMTGPDRPTQKIVVDIDDWYEGLQKENLAHKMTDPEKNPDNNREHYLAIIDNADALITSTQFLYDYYTKEQGKKNVFMVRNAIDIDRWQRRKDHARYLPTVGWVGAVPWRSNDLESLSPFFGEFIIKNRLPFHHSGHMKGVRSSDARLGIPDNYKNVTYSERKIISQYPSMFKKIDIGIVPLSDIEFNYAKSAIKGLEYTAAGIPFIASRSPEYEYVHDLGIGMVANSQEEWLEYLNLLQDPKMRQEEINKSYENLLNTQTMEVRGPEWNDVMNQILAL